MPDNPTIRAELDAAVDAAWPDGERVYADEHGSPEAMMAAAIAAFLHHRAAHYADGPHPMARAIAAWCSETAAAVEAAAKEAGE